MALDMLLNENVSQLPKDSELNVILLVFWKPDRMNIATSPNTNLHLLAIPKSLVHVAHSTPMWSIEARMYQRQAATQVWTSQAIMGSLTQMRSFLAYSTNAVSQSRALWNSTEKYGKETL